MYSKHKDANPVETVNRIKNIYKSVGLQMEHHIQKHIDGIYSAYLHDVDGNWSTAGKGTTEDYCLASAYGESIEHLCNHFAFDTARTSNEAKRHLGFLRYPDETLLPIDNVKFISPDVFDDMRRCCGTGETTLETGIDTIWENIMAAKTTPFVPYYNVSRRKPLLLPDAILAKLCGSNGGASGNTPEEAVGHALDEAIERYAKYKIIYEKLTPPTVPKQYIKERSEELYELIGNIETKGRMTVIVKDASLGMGFTVICVLLIDNLSRRYLSNFGAHPCFEIAVERCLTELFQNHNCVGELIDRNDMVGWDRSSSKETLGLKNWVSLLRDDTGILPDNIFGEKPSWKFEPWPEYQNYTNKMGMHSQLNVLSSHNFDVYIRDNSILGFPVYKIYIPFLSLSHLRFDGHLISASNLLDNMHTYLSRGISKSQKEQLSGYVFGEDSFLPEIKLQNWDKDSLDLFRASILFDTGNPEKALSAIKDSGLREGAFLKRYIELTLEGTCERERNHLLKLFFGNSNEEWIHELSENNAFALVRERCAKVGLIKHNALKYEAYKIKRDTLYRKIKEAAYGAAIDQEAALKSVLSAS